MSTLDFILNNISIMSSKEINAHLKELGRSGKEIVFNRIPTLTKILELNKVDCPFKRIKIKYDYIQNHPGLHWDVANYVGASNIDVLEKVVISTEGHVFKVCKTGRVKYVFLENTYKDKYHRITVDYKSLRTHRVVASTFLPIPEKLLNNPIHKLDASFIDPETTSPLCNINNVEWLYGNERQKKTAGRKRYLGDEYFLFEVVVDNGFKGVMFALATKEITQIGLAVKYLRKVAARKCNLVMGMEVTEINTNAGYDKIPEDLLNTLLKNPKYFNGQIKPIIGEIISGDNKGFKFSLFGLSEVNKYFNNPYIMHSTQKKKISIIGECAFRKATHREAIPLHGKITHEIADLLQAKKCKKIN